MINLIRRLPALRSMISALLIVQLSTAPVTQAVAQSVQLDARNQQTLMDRASNGVPIVHISKPNDAGVSHNLFERFNVGPEGLIFNNSTAPGSSTLGGYLFANPNLVGSDRAANLIIAEVSGSNRSELKGYTEAFGAPADLLLANPFGITCDGCGFVGTPRVTLSTGIPELDAAGRLIGINVGQGDVRIDGAGLDARNLTYFDIVSKAASINATLAGQDIGVTAGAGRFDYRSRNSIGSGTTTGIAIDSSALGGMYAKRIRLVGTENGLGINLNGIVQASEQIDLSAGGTVKTADVNSGGDIAITSRSSDIHLGTQVYASKDSDIRAAGAIHQDNGLLGSGRDLRLTSDQVTVSASQWLSGLAVDGSLSQPGSLTLTALGQFNSTNSIIASTSLLNLVSSQLILDTNSMLWSNQIGLRAARSDLSGQVISRGTLDVEGVTLELRRGGLLSAGSTINANIGDITQDVGASVEAVSDVQLNLGTASLAGQLLSGGAVTIGNSRSNILLRDSSLLSAGSQLILQADRLTQEANATIEAAGPLDLSAQSLNLDGRIASNDGLRITGTATVVTRADILSNGAISIAAPDLKLLGGTIRTGQDFQIRSAQDLDIATNIVSLGRLGVNANALKVHGVFQSVGPMSLSTEKGSLSILGRLHSDGDLELNGGSSLLIGQDANVTALGTIGGRGPSVEAHGVLLAQKQLMLDARAGPLLIGGTLRSDERLSMRSGDRLQLLGSAQLAALDDISLLSRQIDVSGQILSGRSVSISTQGGDLRLNGFVQSQSGTTLNSTVDVTIGASGRLASFGTVRVSDSSNVTNLGLIEANEGIDLSARGSLTLGGTIWSGGTLTATAAGAASQSGLIETMGTISFDADSLDVRGTLLSQNDVRLAARSDMTLDGYVSAYGAQKLASGHDLTLARGHQSERW
jgi:filamentous hemagglutinin